MKHFVSNFSNVVRQNFSVGLLFLAILGVFGGGSEYLASQSAHTNIARVATAHAEANHLPAHHAQTTDGLIYRLQAYQAPAQQAPASAPFVGNDASVAATINQVFGPYAPSATRIASCESGMNPGAYNSSSSASGLFQIIPSTWNSTPFAGYSPFNAWANASAAYSIFVRDGYSWREWQCQ